MDPANLSSSTEQTLKPVIFKQNFTPLHRLPLEEFKGKCLLWAVILGFGTCFLIPQLVVIIQIWNFQKDAR